MTSPNGEVKVMQDGTGRYFTSDLQFEMLPGQTEWQVMRPKNANDSLIPSEDMVNQRAFTTLVNKLGDERANDLHYSIQEEKLGGRIRTTAREFIKRPLVNAIIDDVLAAEANGLGGPQEAGKSLLAKEWALSVATGKPWRGHLVNEQRNVLWMASEGLHDFMERWACEPLWQEAADHVLVDDRPVSLVVDRSVDKLLADYSAERPGLVVFDVIYGMGMADDSGTKDVLPVLASMKRISAEWGCATLAIGHPPLDTSAERFRGSGSWRQLFYTDWFMYAGTLTCHKSKIAKKEGLGARYVQEYPRLRWLSSTELVAEAADRNHIIVEDIAQYPADNVSKRAVRLAVPLGMSVRSARRLIAEITK